MTDVRLIVGPPGTGKTRALTAEAETAGQEYGGRDVVIASLTRTAAKEIAARVDIPDNQTGTLHAHAYHALDRPDLAETPEGLRAWNQDHPDLRLTGGRGALDDLDTPSAIDQGDRTHADDLHQAVMNHRARMTPREQWTDAEREYADAWNDWKAQTDRLDFTDLIERALQQVPQHPAHPRTLLGDEAQDFSTLELALFRQWARHADQAVVAADPLQVIYSWRGADPHAFDRIDQAHTRVLRQSYRLSHAVHAAAVGWAETNGLQVPDYQPRDSEGVVGPVPYTVGHLDPMLDELQAALADGQTVMLLTTCGYMLNPALRTLKQAGIPFHNPLRPARGAWNPLRGASRLAAFLRPREDVWGEKARAWTWDDLRLWTEPLSARDALTRGSKSLIEEKCREDQLGATRAGEEVPLDTLADIFGGTVRSGHPAYRLDVDWWADSLRASQRDKMAYPLEVLRAQGPRALREKPRLTVGTVHSVKGGEADHVILAPDLSKAAMWEGWHRGGEARDHIVRTLYVGLSRARETVTVLAPGGPEHVPVDHLTGRQAVPA